MYIVQKIKHKTPATLILLLFNLHRLRELTTFNAIGWQGFLSSFFELPE